MREHMSHQERRELWRERVAAFYDDGLPATQFGVLTFSPNSA